MKAFDISKLRTFWSSNKILFINIQYTLLKGECEGIPKMKKFRLRTSWYLVFIFTFLWYLYWIYYDAIVWNKVLVEVNSLNYVGAVLSIALIFAGSQLSEVKNMVKKIKTKKIDWKEIEEQGIGEEQSNGEEDLLMVLRELKKEETSQIEEKRELFALKERLQVRTKEEIENIKHGIQTLKNENAELRLQCEEIEKHLSH